MKITTNNKDILIVDHKPWFAGLALIFIGLAAATYGYKLVRFLHNDGWFFILIAAVLAFVFYRFVARVQIVFDRAEGTVEFRRRSLHRYSRKSYPLAEIKNAIVKTGSSSSGGRAASKIVLVRTNDEEPIPFTSASSSGQGRALNLVVDAVNKWLAAG